MLPEAHRPRSMPASCLAVVAAFGLVVLCPSDAVADQRLYLRDGHGRLVEPLATSGTAAAVLLFVREDCPISNRYAPEIQRLAAQFGDRVSFWLVYPSPTSTPQAIAEHRRHFELPVEAVHDPDHQLVRHSGVSITPEAAVFLPSGRLVYRGRIDDRYEDFGKGRAEPRYRDLATVLTEVVSGASPPTRITRAVGCFIADLR